MKDVILSPDDPKLASLCTQLAELSAKSDATQWPAQRLQLCADYGVYRWFVPEEWGGLNWDTPSITKGYLALAKACLTTTFIITQRTGACRRLAVSENTGIQADRLPGLAEGTRFATVGISHLTTSGQHLELPMLRVSRSDSGYLLDGFSPWVTGAAFADEIVIGAVDESGDQFLFCLPTSLEGVTVPDPPEFVGLSGSKTGKVVCAHVYLDASLLLAGPAPNVMSSAVGANTGGHQTSTLALGLAAAAIDFLDLQSRNRNNLLPIAEQLQAQWNSTTEMLIDIASGGDRCSNETLRTEANSLVLRSTQAALSAAKGTGYLADHPVGRWCREALFFLVWSCPQGVVDANLCELAGIHSS